MFDPFDRSAREARWKRRKSNRKSRGRWDHWPRNRDHDGRHDPRQCSHCEADRTHNATARLAVAG